MNYTLVQLGCVIWELGIWIGRVAGDCNGLSSSINHYFYFFYFLWVYNKNLMDLHHRGTIVYTKVHKSIANLT